MSLVPHVLGQSIKGSVFARGWEQGAWSGEITKGHELLEDDVYVHCQ